MSACKGAAILWYSKIGQQREARAAIDSRAGATRAGGGGRSLVIMPAPCIRNRPSTPLQALARSSDQVRWHQAGVNEPDIP